MALTDCNADVQANALFTSLTADSPTPPTLDLSDSKFDFVKDTTSDLYADVTSVTLSQLTTVSLDGDGVFDQLMQAMDLHIQREYKGNRITGDQYAKVYTEVTTAVLGQSVQFLLNKDQAKWAAITAQMQGRVAEIQATEALINLEKVKIEAQKAVFEMQNSGAEYALTKMNVAIADAQYCLTQAQGETETYKRNWLMPAELAIQEYTRSNILVADYAGKMVTADRILPAEASIIEYQNRILQPLEKGIQEFQLNETLPVQQATSEYNLNAMLPVQLGKEQHLLNFQMPAQTNLIKEQFESQRGNTLNTRSDGLTVVSGMLGRQKDAVIEDIRAKAFNVDNVLPIQLDLVKEQRESERANTLDKRSDNVTVVAGVIGLQKRNLTADASTKEFGLAQTLPTQITLLGKQILLTTEQAEAERSKTLDTRSDNSTIVKGMNGKQKDLYTQQIDSFIKDAKHKAAKMYLDGWITSKTLDENLATPTQLDVPSVSAVLLSLRSANGL
jgi:hypothetical protein